MLKLKKPKAAEYAPAKTNRLEDPWTGGVHQSALALFLECREKARIRYVLGYDSNAVSYPLIFGDLSHRATAKFHDALASGKKLTVETAAVAMRDWLKLAQKEHEKSDGPYTTAQSDIVEMSIIVLQKLLPYYVKHWWKDFSEVEWVAAEKDFKIDKVKLELLAAPVAGTYDGVFRRVKTGKLWLLETKNKGQWSSSLVDTLPIDLQVGFYLTAMAEENKDVEGVLYNLIRRPQEKLGAKESLKAYAERIEVRVKQEPKHYFDRFAMKLTKGEKFFHLQRMRYLVKEYVEWWDKASREVKTKDLLMNTGACGNYGKCQYLQVCTSNDVGGLKANAC